MPVAAARALKRNDRVGLIAPGTRPESPAVLSYAAKVIEEMGLVPVFGKNILKYQGHLAGSDEERLADLNGFIQDQSIAAIFCVTGGFGALPLLPHIDFATIKSSRKLIVGSDENTVLLLSVLKQCSLRSVLGPNLDRVRSKTSFESLRSAVTSKNTSRIECFSQNLGEISIAKSYSFILRLGIRAAIGRKSKRTALTHGHAVPDRFNGFDLIFGRLQRALRYIRSLVFQPLGGGRTGSGCRRSLWRLQLLRLTRQHKHSFARRFIRRAIERVETA